MSYQITIRFSTNRPLTLDEQELILNACLVQVEEPVGSDGEDMEVDTKIFESEIQDHS